MSALADVLLHAPNSLSRGERELIAAYVSSLNECGFCHHSHAAVASCHLGDEGALVDAVVADAERAPVSAKLKALLAIAARVQRSGRDVRDADIARARAEGRDRRRDSRHRAHRRGLLHVQPLRGRPRRADAHRLCRLPRARAYVAEHGYAASLQSTRPAQCTMTAPRQRSPGTTGTRRSAAARFSIPEVTDLLQEIFNHQYPRFDGEVAADRRTFVSPADAAQHLKEKALEFGADIVGICEIEPSDVYRGRVITEKYAIAVGQRMRWREFQVVPSKASAIECLRVYFTLGETVIQLAAYIRSIGYACKVEHPIGDSDLLHIPIGLKAGFGELGRHGSIIHPTLGPLFRMGSVITSIELEIDQPIDAGIAQVLRFVPRLPEVLSARAIPDERSPEAGKDHLGYDRYVVDTGRCFPVLREVLVLLHLPAGLCLQPQGVGARLRGRADASRSRPSSCCRRRRRRICLMRIADTTIRGFGVHDAERLCRSVYR